MHAAARDAAAYDRRATSDLRGQRLYPVDECKVVRFDEDAGFDTARKAGLRRKFREVPEAKRSRQLAHVVLGEPGNDEGRRTE